MYALGIRILAKGYLPNTLIIPEKLQEIVHEVSKHCELPILIMI